MVNIEFFRSSEIVTLSTNNLKIAKTALWHFKPNWGIIRIDTSHHKRHEYNPPSSIS